MLEEFKKFALRGNVVDLAIGVIIGAAFGKIVESIVGDIFMPIIGAVTGGLDFSNYFMPLSGKVPAAWLYAEAKKQGAVLGWGNFVTIAINFLIIAWVLFLVVKGINRMKRKAEAEVDGDARARAAGRREAPRRDPRHPQDADRRRLIDHRRRSIASHLVMDRPLRLPCGRGGAIRPASPARTAKDAGSPKDRR